METAKFLGYTISKTHRDAGTDEYQDHDEGDHIYKLFIELNKLIFFFTFRYSYGSCFSGYCSASWGEHDNELVLYTDTLPELIKPSKDVFINTANGKAVISIEENEESWDAVISSIKTTEKVPLISDTGNGGCGYYSSGVVTLNESLF